VVVSATHAMMRRSRERPAPSHPSHFIAFVAFVAFVAGGAGTRGIAIDAW